MTTLERHYTRNVQDLIQFREYLESNIGSGLVYLTFRPSNQAVIIGHDSFVNTNTLDTLVAAYTNPISTARKGVQIDSTLYTDAVCAYSTGGQITVGNTLIVQSTVNSTIAVLDSGSIRTAGGLTVSKDIYSGGIIVAAKGFDARSYKIINVQTPTDPYDCATKEYVDSRVAILTTVDAGYGLQKSGNVLNVLVDNASVEISSNKLRVAAGLAGTGLSGGSGIALSVNSALNHVTSLGVLNGLTSSGQVHITNSTASTSITTGSLIVSGGMGLSGRLNMGGLANLRATEDSVNVSTGSLIVSGGVGIAKRVNIGGVTSILSTVDSTDSTSGSLVVSGGIGVTGTVSTSKVRLPGSVKVTATAGNYTMTLPTALPTTSSLLKSDATGQLSYSEIPGSINTNGVISLGAVKIFTTTEITTIGTITVYLTSNRTLTGTPIFTNTIYYAHGSAENDTTHPVKVPTCSLRYISVDLKTAIFNVVIGSSDSTGNGSKDTLQFAPNGITVRIIFFGM